MKRTVLTVLMNSPLHPRFAGEPKGARMARLRPSTPATTAVGPRIFASAVAAVSLVAAMAVGAGCSNHDLAGTEALVVVDARNIKFGNTLVGETATRDLKVANDGRLTAVIEVLVEPPFTVDRTRFEVRGGESRSIEVVFAPNGAASATGKLELTAGSQRFEVSLSGFGVIGQDCHSSTPCRIARFDVETVRCEETLLDDVPCENACLVNPVCRQGECVGDVRNCSVDSQCRTGACDPAVGCIAVDSSQARCPHPANPCLVPSCSEDGRCGQTAVADGVACGPASCGSAFVCQSGACVEQAVTGDACPQSPLCTHDGWCWENPLPQGARLNAVSASGSEIWAVGDGGVALRFTDDGWALARTGTTHDLQAVHATETGAWMVGRSGTILRWRNAAILKIAPPSASLEYTAVWVSGDDDAFVASADGRVWRFVDGEWIVDRSQTGLSRPKLAGNDVDDLWMIGRADSARTLYRRTDAGWAPTWTDSNASTWDLVALENGGVAVLGLQWDGFQRRQFAFVTDGDSLEAIASPPLPAPPVQFLSGDSTDSLWSSGRFGAVRRFDGESWSEFETGQRLQLTAANIRNDVGWAVGESGAMARVDGETWAPLSSRADARPSLLRSVWAGSSGNAWAVGAQGQVLRSEGKRWFRVAAPTSSTLHAVYGSESGDATGVWAVGEGGLVLRWNGNHFVQEEPPTTRTLRSVWSSAPNRAWVVGDEGTVLLYDGSAWRNHGQGVGGRVNDVVGRSASDVFVGGENGLWHWDGNTLSPVDAPSDSPVLSLGVSSNALYALVDLGASQTAIFRHDGNAWGGALPEIPAVRGARKPLRNVHASGDDSLWAVGDDGVFFWNGSTWSHQTASNGLYDVFARSGDDTLVVGEQGFILRRE